MPRLRGGCSRGPDDRRCACGQSGAGLPACGIAGPCRTRKRCPRTPRYFPLTSRPRIRMVLHQHAGNDGRRDDADARAGVPRVRADGFVYCPRTPQSRLRVAPAGIRVLWGSSGGPLPKEDRHPGWPGHRVRERPGNGITRIVRFVGVLASSGQRRRFGAPGGHDDARASGNGVRSRQGRANDERHLAQFRRHEHDADHRAGGGWPRASGLGSGRCILRDGGELRRRDPHHVISARGAGDAEERRDRERSGS